MSPKWPRISYITGNNKFVFIILECKCKSYSYQVFCRSFRINAFFVVEGLRGLVGYFAMNILQGLSLLALKM